MKKFRYSETSGARRAKSLQSIPWTVTSQPPLSMRFPRQEYWSGLPFPSPGELPDQRIESVSLVTPALQADSLPREPTGKPCPVFG